jgi:hypothetical protein
MTAIAEGPLHFRACFMNILRRLPHKLSAALDQYGERRIRHAVSRSQLRHAQRDIIQVRRAIHAQAPEGLHKEVGIEPTTGK